MALLDADLERRMTKLERTNKFLRLLAVTLRCMAMLFAIFLFLPYLKEARESPFVAFFWSLDYRIALFIKGLITTEFAGHDFSRWAPLVISFIASLRVDDMADNRQIKLREFRIKDHYAQWLVTQGIAADAPILKPLQKQIDNLKISPSGDREELLRVFADAKRKLDAMGRDLAFLAADVADSTGMKQGEDAGTVMHAFREYRHYVEGCFEKHGVMKAAWTPDGVMACFTTVDAAASAAIDIIQGLPDFNKNVQTMKRDFMVRCGINAGYVYFDENQPLEQLSDRVLDIAGHMQKQARPNTVCIAKPAVEPMRVREQFTPSGEVVSGYEVYEWSLGGHNA